MSYVTEIYDRLNHQPTLLGVPYILIIINVAIFVTLVPVLSSIFNLWGLFSSVMIFILLFFVFRILSKIDYFEIFGRFNGYIDTFVSSAFVSGQEVIIIYDSQDKEENAEQ